VALLALVSGCGPRDAAAASPVASGASAADGPYRVFQEPDAGIAPLIDLIGRAKQLLRLAIYQLADSDVVQALLDARARGVAVHVLLDAAYHGRAANVGAYDRLAAGGVDVQWASPTVLFHEKVLIQDDAAALIGTGNISKKFRATARDFWIEDRRADEVAAIAATIDQDMRRSPGDRLAPAVEAGALVWSPARADVLRLISDARQSLDLMTEEFTDRTVAAAVARAAARGVRCRVVMSENPASAEVLSRLVAAGCVAHVYPVTSTGLYFHAKQLRVDGTLLIGSQNLSPTSLLSNRELSVRLTAETAPNLLSAVAAAFERDFEGQAGSASTR
jgi:phosphatidylserine/phosphatidylglycerophosphate/cardiolipin synthase-like enzyme